MPKRASGSLFLPLDLDPGSAIPLYRQLYKALRDAILSGQLAAGTRLPSTRNLANMLGIARTTVVVAFEQLLAEGYVEGQQGSGTYVSAILPEESPTGTTIPSTQSVKPPSLISTNTNPMRHISQRGQLPRAQTSATIQPSVAHLRAFMAGQPDLENFPFKTWAQLSTQRWRQPPRELLSYSDPAGYMPLRIEISAYLKAVRGVQCEAEQVMIMAGAQQGIALAAQVLLDPGDTAWLEDPCYPSAHRALQGAGAHITAIPVDKEGLNIAYGIEHSPDARLVYVTPSYQYPSGATMSLSRRLLLLQWASRSGAWILEDDYDCEYRYAGHPLSSLQGLDSTGQVIYIGTFSKVLFPGLRLGYLVVPSDLLDAFVAARATADRHTSMHEQLVLTDFLHQGHFARHIRHMRQLYAERQHTLVEAAHTDLRGLLEVSAAETGMHLIGWLPTGISDQQAFQQAATHEIAALPLSLYRIHTCLPNGLLLGYTAVTPDEIREGVKRLAQALEKYDHMV